MDGLKLWIGVIMSINELMVFVSLVCNFDAPSKQVPRIVKERCMEYYTNCVITGDGSKIDRLQLSNCNLKAAEASKNWGK